VRANSRRKREPAFPLQWRVAALERWRSMSPPARDQLRIDPIDFQGLRNYSAPKSLKNVPKSLADVDLNRFETYQKLNVPLHERARLAGIAVDPVFDSRVRGHHVPRAVAAVCVIFCSFWHAVQHHPELIERTWAAWCRQATLLLLALCQPAHRLFRVFSDRTTNLNQAGTDKGGTG
jgi:Fe-S cluster assembly protein SufB